MRPSTFAAAAVLSASVLAGCSAGTISVVAETPATAGASASTSTIASSGSMPRGTDTPNGSIGAPDGTARKGTSTTRAPGSTTTTRRTTTTADHDPTTTGGGSPSTTSGSGTGAVTMEEFRAELIEAGMTATDADCIVNELAARGFEVRRYEELTEEDTKVITDVAVDCALKGAGLSDFTTTTR